MEKKKCVLCGGEIEGTGHNPYPLATLEEGVCCTECNETEVIPARMSGETT